jgi:heme O synthase-like polyprenyltransferase
MRREMGRVVDIWGLLHFWTLSVFRDSEERVVCIILADVQNKKHQKSGVLHSIISTL